MITYVFKLHFTSSQDSDLSPASPLKPLIPFSPFGGVFLLSSLLKKSEIKNP